jgi:hypothetical protein
MVLDQMARTSLAMTWRRRRRVDVKARWDYIAIA